LKYDNYDYEAKFQVFAKNYKMLLVLSQESGMNSVQELSPFLDVTPEEFKKQYLNLKVSDIESIKKNAIGHLEKANDIPENYNWKDHNAVAPVRNQGSCGSCWAFSAVGNIEGVYSIKHGAITVFSEQQLVDCDKAEDEGCNGGLMESAFKYLETTKGLEVEADYKYEGRDGKCRYNEEKGVAKVTGFKYAPSQNEDEIAAMLVATGPLAVALDATPLQWYFGGIYKPWFSWSCSKTELNHGVLLVGYGVEKGVAYWLVKNSWGSGWGESGYFRIFKGDGTCGINTYVISAVVE